MDQETIKTHITISNEEIKVVDITKKENILFIKLSNNRKFLTDGILIQEFSEYEHFCAVFSINGAIYIIMEKERQNYLIEFKTKEIIVSFANYIDYYFRQNENMFRIGEKLFNLKTKTYIPHTENLKPKTFYCLGNDLYLFETTEADILKRVNLILNENGEQIFNCGDNFPYLIKDNLLLIAKDNAEIKIEKYLNGKINTENEIIIRKEQTKPHYYKGNICIVKNNTIYIISPNLEILKQIAFPFLGNIKNSQIENDTLLVIIKQENERVKIAGINLLNERYFEAEDISTRPYDMSGPATKLTIAMDNINYDEYGREIYHVRVLDENFDLLFEMDNVVDYDYIVSKNKDKIWLKTDENGVLYNASHKKGVEITYTDIQYQSMDENSKIEYGFAFDENTKKLQILDEIGNVLIESIPYEQIGFEIYNRQIGFYYLNGYACITKRDVIFANYEIVKNSIIDNKGNIIYNKQNTIVSPIENYFQIKEEEKTIYFNTLNGKFSEKHLINSNNTPLLETTNQFEITEDGGLILKQILK